MKRISSALTGTALALAALLVFQLCAAASALAAMQVVVGNPGLQHFDSDGGVELDFGLTDQNGQPVGNLRPDNLRSSRTASWLRFWIFAASGRAVRSISCS